MLDFLVSGQWLYTEFYQITGDSFIRGEQILTWTHLYTKFLQHPTTILKLTKMHPKPWHIPVYLETETPGIMTLFHSNILRDVVMYKNV